MRVPTGGRCWCGPETAPGDSCTTGANDLGEIGKGGARTWPKLRCPQAAPEPSDPLEPSKERNSHVIVITMRRGYQGEQTYPHEHKDTQAAGAEEGFTMPGHLFQTRPVPAAGAAASYFEEHPIVTLAAAASTSPVIEHSLVSAERFVRMGLAAGAAAAPAQPRAAGLERRRRCRWSWCGDIARSGRKEASIAGVSAAGAVAAAQ